MVVALVERDLNVGSRHEKLEDFYCRSATADFGAVAADEVAGGVPVYVRQVDVKRARGR